MNHIITKYKDDKIEEWIATLMHNYLDGASIQYSSPKTKWFDVEKDHKWDFIGNVYRIILPRKFIISCTKDGEYKIEETSDCWSNSDYGENSKGTTYFLMEEIDH